jgi:N-acetylglutamate synthase-like GNAT family acetyltransferase
MDNKIEYSIKDGYNEMDFDKVTDMLKDVFWSIGIKKEEVMQGAKNSALLVGAFDSNNDQIAFSRVVSDKTRFAYIMDVVVNEPYRKKGIGQAMIQYILNHHELKDVYRWLLSTKDAHGVYQKVGFNSLAKPDNWMQIRHDRPER